MSKTFQVPNPFWLSDTFIYKFKQDLGNTVYVKVNGNHKIEEIGIDIEKRMHNAPLSEIEKLKDCKEATRLNKSILNRIGDEYWWLIKNKSR